jgi:hypothetical protein
VTGSSASSALSSAPSSLRHSCLGEPPTGQRSPSTGSHPKAPAVARRFRYATIPAGSRLDPRRSVRPASSSSGIACAS